VQPSSRAQNYNSNISSAGTNASMMGSSATGQQQNPYAFQSTSQSAVTQM